VSLHISNERCGYGIDRKHKVAQLEPSLHDCSAVKMVGTAAAGNLPEEMDGLLRDCGMPSGRHLSAAG
jgi:hypothetical protein